MAEYSIDNSGWLANVNVSKPLTLQMDTARTLRRSITAEHKQVFLQETLFMVEEFKVISELATERLAHKLQQEQEQRQHLEIEKEKSTEEKIRARLQWKTKEKRAKELEQPQQPSGMHSAHQNKNSKSAKKLAHEYTLEEIAVLATLRGN